MIITACDCVSGLVLFVRSMLTFPLNYALKFSNNAGFDASSEVVVASVIFVVIRVIPDVSIVVNFFSVVRLFIIRLEGTFSLVLTLGPKSSLSLAHLIELRVVLVFSVVLENFIFLVLQVLVLQFLNNFLLLGTALAILEVIHVELILQVVNVCILLHVCAVEPL